MSRRTKMPPLLFVSSESSSHGQFNFFFVGGGRSYSRSLAALRVSHLCDALSHTRLFEFFSFTSISSSTTRSTLAVCEIGTSEEHDCEKDNR